MSNWSIMLLARRIAVISSDVLFFVGEALPSLVFLRGFDGEDALVVILIVSPS